ncbi:hypothetical protein Poli38472_011725 [Pythium oligandrum]|uniref:Large-conductance mechanosensitive channel n=1 Tax=Pythium oligandrum TaxID=41045 RepID=A0A8K1C8Y5_PYTOL|nr:hypothetical protein Poli38472_011725 [Pythium oligandrum]|eukprot:TMW58137.1 hypothetical protein Poli38472_011725 [Pythium oligandrum]
MQEPTPASYGSGSGPGPAPPTSSSRSNSELSLLIQRTRTSIEALAPPIDKVRTFFDDFQDFIQQGNMVDLAVGLILGKCFTTILDSFVSDILTPILSLFSERSLANFYLVARCPPTARDCSSTTWPTWEQARKDGAVTVNYGQFVENFINFLINALFLYIAIKKVFEILFNRSIVLKRQCPECKEFVRGNATICKECGHHFQ